MQFGLLSLTQATNACITLLLVFVFLLIIGPFESQRRIHLGMYYILISISFLLFALTILPHFAWLLNAIGKDVTISGRTPLWERVIDVMLHHNSFTGFGLLMFWRDPKATILLQREFARNTYFATHTVGAHNLLLELWLTVGIFGIGIYFICLLSSFKKINQLKPDQYLLCAAIINCVMLFGLTDRGFALANDYKVFFLFLAMAIANTREVKPEWLFKQEEDPKTDVISYQKSES